MTKPKILIPALTSNGKRYIELSTENISTESGDNLQEFLDSSTSGGSTYIPTSTYINSNSTDSTYPTSKAVFTTVKDALAGLNKLEKKLVTEVPTVDTAEDNVIYLYKIKEGTYQQYMLISGEIVNLGSTEIDLSDYVVKDDLKTVAYTGNSADLEDFPGWPIAFASTKTVDWENTIRMSDSQISEAFTYNVPDNGLMVISFNNSSGQGRGLIYVNDTQRLVVEYAVPVLFPVSKGDVFYVNLLNGITCRSTTCFVPYKATDNVATWRKDMQLYSTDEVEIGTWIDGKTIYRKVYDGSYRASTTPSGLTSVTNYLEIENVIRASYVRAVNGIGRTHFVDLTVYRNSTNNTFLAQANVSNESEAVSGAKYYVILEYTKVDD